MEFWFILFTSLFINISFTSMWIIIKKRNDKIQELSKRIKIAADIALDYTHLKIEEMKDIALAELQIQQSMLGENANLQSIFDKRKNEYESNHTFEIVFAKMIKGKVKKNKIQKHAG